MKTFDDRKQAILPIGNVNTKNGKNRDFGTIWDCWEKDEEATNQLWRQMPEFGHEDKGPKFMAVHSCGLMEDEIGDKSEFKHDQTGRHIGNIFKCWELIGTFKHDEDGLRDLGEAAGQTSVKFYCYK